MSKIATETNINDIFLLAETVINDENPAFESIEENQEVEDISDDEVDWAAFNDESLTQEKLQEKEQEQPQTDDIQLENESIQQENLVHEDVFEDDVPQIPENLTVEEAASLELKLKLLDQRKTLQNKIQAGKILKEQEKYLKAATLTQKQALKTQKTLQVFFKAKGFC